MIPLILADPHQACFIRRVGGRPETRQHLENLGFVPGEKVTVISANGGNLIVKAKESRVAVSEELARKIMV